MLPPADVGRRCVREREGKPDAAEQHGGLSPSIKGGLFEQGRPQLASTIEPEQNGRIYIELVNAPFLKAGGSPPASTGQCVYRKHHPSVMP